MKYMERNRIRGRYLMFHDPNLIGDGDDDGEDDEAGEEEEEEEDGDEYSDDAKRAARLDRIYYKVVPCIED